jgi:dTDP-4-amino-4,6-dideoxygalactose transaminase
MVPGSPAVIPFNKPTLWGKEIEYVVAATQSGHISGDGLFTKKCHQFLEETLSVPKALLTTSGTHALEVAALLLDVGPGDEVMVPSFTFVSTVNAFVLRGATPVFIDIRRDTLNIDEQLLSERITDRTKAIVPVHYAGVGCEMDAIMPLAQRHGIPVVEDNAHGLFGRYRGRHLGTFGEIAAQSFHETKNFTCGEGGALLIGNPAYVDRAEILREKGTNRSSFFRGMVDKYSWVDVGSSYLPSDLLAAFLFAQLESHARVQATRRRIWEYYERNLSEWALDRGTRLPFVPPHCNQSFHMFYLIVRSLEERQALITHLKGDGVMAVFHYLPLHLSVMGRRYGGKSSDCPVTEEISDRIVRLPFFCELTEEQLAHIVASLRRFRWPR